MCNETNRINKNSKAVYQGKAIYKHHPKSKQVIVFIHGIIEGPKQFRHLAQIAYLAGYSTNILLLPGHGGSGRAFAGTSYKQWINYVTTQVKRMKRIYDEVLLVGHSMGALLALCEAAADENKMTALVLMDVPLKIHLWPRVVKGALKIGFGDIKPWENYTRAEYKAISVGKAPGWGYLGWVIRYCELFVLIGYAKKQILKVRKPMLVVFARKDEFVSLKSRQYFRKNNLVVQELILEDSGHFCYNYLDLIRLEKMFKMFIDEQKEKVSKSK